MRISDKLKPIYAAMNLGATSSALTSPPLSLEMGRDFSVIAEIGTCSTVALAAPIQMSIRAATAYGGSYSTVSSGIVVMASGATYTNMSEVRIAAKGTWSTASAGALTIDGIAISRTEDANNTAATAAAYMSSGATLVVLGLETVIPAVCTNLLCTRISTVATAIEVKVYPKDAGYTFNAKSSANPNTGGDGPLGVMGGKKVFAYDFKTEDIVDANSSYTHAQVYLYTTGSSAIPMDMIVLEGGRRFMPPARNVDRGQMSTISSAFAT